MIGWRKCKPFRFRVKVGLCGEQIKRVDRVRMFALAQGSTTCGSSAPLQWLPVQCCAWTIIFFVNDELNESVFIWWEWTSLTFIFLIIIVSGHHVKYWEREKMFGRVCVLPDSTHTHTHTHTQRPWGSAPHSLAQRDTRSEIRARSREAAGQWLCRRTVETEFLWSLCSFSHRDNWMSGCSGGACMSCVWCSGGGLLFCLQ